MKKQMVLFSLLIFLVSGACRHPAQTPSAAQGGKYGKIRIIAQDETKPETAARTVLPAMVFDKYVYTFTKTGQTTGTELSPDSGGFFTLETGNYTVEVKAYIGAAALYTLAASGISAPFTVGPGDNDPVVVPLKPAAEGQGEFSYIITYPEEAWADIALYQWPEMADAGLSPSHVCDANGVTELLELEAGTYLLTVQVSKGGKFVSVTEAVHIYPLLTTVYTKDFVDEDFHAAPQTVTPDRFEYYWIDEHDSLVTTNGSQTTIAPGEILAIAALEAGYTVQQWHVDGASTGHNGNTYYFTSAKAGNYTVGLFVTKNGKLYNTNISVTVGSAAEPVTRSVTIDMYDSIGDGWQGSGALRINVNGINIANTKVGISYVQNIPSGQKYTNTYTFPVVTGDTVKLYWVAGNSQGDNSFIVYYTDTPPVPAFSAADNKGAQRWSGDNALIYKIRGAAPDGLANAADGALLGEFTVE